MLRASNRCTLPVPSPAQLGSRWLPSLHGLKGPARSCQSTRARHALWSAPREGHPTLQRPHRSPRAASPRWASSPATCAGRGTRRPATSSRSIDPELLGRRSARTRSGPAVRLSAGGAGAPRGRRRVRRAACRRRRRTSTDYLTQPRWYQDGQPSRTQGRRGAPQAIAYFSPEFGITEVLPQYSGGLGILAGDHLKSASDLGVPHRRRRPVLQDRLLQAVAQPRRLAAGDLPGPRPGRAAAVPAARARRHARPWSRSTCPAGRQLHAHVWRAQVGRVPLLLLDSDVPGNDEAARSVTDRALRRWRRARGSQQELLLGIGGVRALRTLVAADRRPGAGRLPHQRGPRRVPGHRADPRAGHRARR